LLLKQSLARQDRQSFRSASGFVFEGKDISLASFANVVHRHDEASKINLGFEIERKKISSNQTFASKHVQRIKVNFSVGIRSPFESVKISWFLVDEETPFEANFKITSDQVVLESYANVETLEHAMDLEKKARKVSSIRKKEQDAFKYFYTNGSRVESDPKIEEAPIDERIKALSFFLQGNFPTVGYENRGAVASVLDDLLSLARLETISFFRGVKHTGPLREISERLSYDGGLLTDEGVQGQEFSEKSSNSASQVSEWLLKLTGGRYQFQPVEFYAEKVRFLGSLKSQILIDTQTGTPVTFADVGVGLSQVLPILNDLNGLLLGSVSQSRTLLIEQPELHLHPAMQADLTDLFIDAVVSKPNVQIIVETHSEQMLLRVLKSLRDGKLAPNQVSVLFVDKAELGETGGNSGFVNWITNIPLAEDDNFEIELPLSFTRLRLRDLF
jgi:hypothetical protein